MSLEPEVQALSQSHFFRDIAAQRLKLLAFMSDVVLYRTGETVCEQGDEGDTAYFILEGEANIVINTPDGPQVAATVSSQDIVGEIAMLCDIPRTAGIVAKTDLRIMVITREAFFNLMNEFPEVSMKVIRLLAERLENTTRDLADVRGRYNTLMQSSGTS